MKTAEFKFENGVYMPRNANAVAATAVISTRYLRNKDDLLAVKSIGYTPVDVDSGQEIYRLDVVV